MGLFCALHDKRVYRIQGVCVALTLFTALQAQQDDDSLYDPWADNCEVMDPGNYTSPETSPLPYQLTLNRHRIPANLAVYFTITALEQRTFEGFMVQARDDQSGEAVGEFDTQFEDAKVINCFAKKDNTATHANYTTKTEVRLRWSPYEDDDGSVTFYATIAEKVEPLERYWVCQKGPSLLISKAPKPSKLA